MTASNREQKAAAYVEAALGRNRAFLRVARAIFPRHTASAVAPDSVEIVRDIYDRWDRGELPWSADALDAYAPDVEWIMPHPGLRAQGRDELVRLWRRFLGTWDDYRIEVDEIRPAGEGQVIVFFSEHVRGKGAGVATESHGGAVWRLKAGKVIGYEAFSDRKDALEAAGLSGN